MADEEKVRAKLVVTSVATARKVGENNVVQTFSAHIEGQEEKKGYETWGQVLVDLVQPEAVLDCEITDIQKGEQTIHRVTQMFDAQGKPIRPSTRGGGKGGGGYYGKTPEQLASERASIESQTAYNGIIELIKVNVINLEHNQAKTALDWAEKKMRATLNVRALVQKEEKAPAPQSAETKVEAKPVEAKPEEKAAAAEAAQPELEPEKPKEKTLLSEETRHKVAGIIAERNYDPMVIQAHILRVYKVGNSRELTEEQGLELLEWVEKGEGIPVMKEA